MVTILMIFQTLYQLQRNHNQNREDFRFSRPWPWAYFLNGLNAAASIAPTSGTAFSFQESEECTFKI